MTIYYKDGTCRSHVETIEISLEDNSILLDGYIKRPIENIDRIEDDN